MNAPRAMGKSLIPDPERSPLVRRAFQDFATGRFAKDEVRKAVSDQEVDRVRQHADVVARSATQEETMKQPTFPQGWDEERVRRVLEHYETQSDEEAVG
ncbi:MAG: hypothetical protein AUF76_07030 [Acidobacteria bacterium 13_1_20CM_2_65_9]|nr:MAG: hypothetical protein AUF76_07030 [Acidobacteria bacterium 13_1_20CM_2_65_9]